MNLFANRKEPSTLKGEGILRPDQPVHPVDDWNAKATAIISNECVIPPPELVQISPVITVFADNIEQSMEYYLSKEMGVLGSSWALFALGAAL